MSGISRMGETAEARFCRITGATKPRHKSDGDASLMGYHVEIKHVGSTNIAQIRAVKFIPLVCWDGANWYVAPPDEVVRLMAQCDRGKYTENPLECGQAHINAIRRFRVPSEDVLKSATLEAIHHGQRFPALRDLMREIVSNTGLLAHEAKQTAIRLLAEIGPSVPPLSYEMTGGLFDQQLR